MLGGFLALLSAVCFSLNNAAARRGEAVVEADGGVDFLHDLVGTGGETPAPHLVAHVVSALRNCGSMTGETTQKEVSSPPSSGRSTLVLGALAAIIGGMARFNDQPVMVIGHQKGRDTKDKIYRNFGYARPEGYRKALRLMKTAEKFKLPVFTFVDTPGAYPGIDAEERSQSEAIGRNIFEMAQLEVPIITTIIGEGGSGGALAISVADQVLMLQYSVYSVISPEGCASILWKTSDRAEDAAEALGITAHRLKALGLIDKIVNEPVGGAHRDPKQMSAQLKRGLNDAWRQVTDMKVKELLERRYERLQSYGRFSDTKADAR
mgnify:CR=1 FL=1